jgi:predicted dehydrogenase
MTGKVLPVPRVSDPRDAPSLSWGVLAPGTIASDFVDGLARHTGQRVVAAGSRSTERAEAFARPRGIDRAYGSYEQLVADPEVDVVYVAAVHTEHLRLALLAIAAGKHVLVEKPMTVTAAEASILVDAARTAGVFAMEAMWTRYLPQTDIVRQLLADGTLGEVRVVTADFGGSTPYDPASRSYDPRLAGGALLDLGVYPVSWAVFALGLPNAVLARGQLAPSGVDQQAALLLTAEHGAQALLSTGLRSSTPSTATVSGTVGRVEVDAPFWAPSGLRALLPGQESPLSWRDDSGIRGRDGMVYEAAALAHYVSEGRLESPLHPLDEVVGTLAVLDEARQQLGYLDVGATAG